MATELELKLMVQPEYLKSACAFLDTFCEKNSSAQDTSSKSSRQATLDLMNGYYDTANALLLENGIALRIRAVNREFIQTVKTRGSSRVGMHARGEWEWHVDSDGLDLTLLSEVPLPKPLQDMQWSRDLIEVFRTDFQRHVWLIHYKSSVLEVVCDEGEVSSAYGRDNICELELELKSGDEGALYEFAHLIAQQVPVQVSVVSKAQKGSRLKHRRIEFPSKPNPQDSLLSFAEYWYETWLVYWEAMFYLQDEALLQPIRSSIYQLKQCVPTELSNRLEALDQCYDSLFKVDREGLLERLASKPETGIMMLSTGQWLNQQLDRPA